MRNAGHYVADRKPLAAPVFVSWPLYLAIGDVVRFVDAGEWIKAMAALGALYLDSEMGPLIRKLESEL